MNTQSTQCPLCVDLDGTLVKSDLLLESLFALLKANLFYVFLLPFWLSKGKANLKHEIAKRAEVDVSLLPYNKELIEFLETEKNKGRKILLVTATNRKYADQVAAHTNLFDDVLASNIETNLSGSNKLKAIQTHLDQPFVYAGNDDIDLKVWQHSHSAIVVSDDTKLIASAEKITHIEKTFGSGTNPLAHLKAMRPHQWIKNLLIFLPLLAAHQITNSELFFQAIIAFFAFSLCASSVYLLNDLLDLPLDRHHHSKRNRPYASGSASLKEGAILIPILLGIAFIIALLLPIEFLGVLVFYYSCTMLYSLKLKNVVLVDAILLAGLYTLRIIAGAAAVSVELSFWLLAFSMFIFLSLAMVKRYSELQNVVKKGQKTIRGRGYQTCDLETLISFGGASGYMAILVMALYINSEDVSQMYAHPEIIWLLCPLLLFWVSKIWLVTRRGWMHDDPVVYAIKDRNSRIVLIIAALIMAMAL